MSKNIYTIPSEEEPIFCLTPYYYFRKNLKTKEESVQGGMAGEVTAVGPLYVHSFSGLIPTIRKKFNLSDSDKVRVEPIGDDWFDSIQSTFTPSIHVSIKTKDYFIGISYDCHVSINAYLWGKSEGAW